jgi:large subunit ribosomal protein L6
MNGGATQMSRIGKKPIEIPTGVTITINKSTVTVKGPKGELTRSFSPDMSITIEENLVTVSRPSDVKEHRALHGTTRALLANMVEGVSTGFTRGLELIGVGYRAQKQGSKLILNVGFSHPVEIEPEEGIEVEVPVNTKITIKGTDKERVGALAANIRGVRPPEPYKGKGIRYEGEVVRRKEGKTGK